MEKRNGMPLVASILLVLIGFAVGCMGTTPESRFYVLSPMMAPEKKIIHDELVGVFPVRLPEYLDHPQIITRVSPNELRKSEFDRWAEPLKENFTRVLIENLLFLLGPDKVLAMPRTINIPITRSVFVEVFQFDGNSAGEVVLFARWSLFQSNFKTLLQTKTSTFKESAGGPGYEPFVAACSRALASLSSEIALAIKSSAKSS
jgi:uncharacterized lipoprotein YmbA